MPLFKLTCNSGDRKVFHAENLDEAKKEARIYFRTNLVYES
jgi:hypothetical protein